MSDISPTHITACANVPKVKAGGRNGSEPTDDKHEDCHEEQKPSNITPSGDKKEGSLFSNLTNIAGDTLKSIGNVFLGESVTNTVSNVFNDTINKMTGIFSPFTNFILNFGNEAGNNVSNDKEKNAKEFSNIIKNINSQIAADKDLSANLSERTRKALEQLSKLSEREDLKNVDIAKIIAEWRKNKNSRSLLRLAQCLRNQRCSDRRDQELRDNFAEGLELFSQLIDEALQASPGENQDVTVHHATQGADALVDGVERREEVRERGSALTTEDKEFIGQKLEEAAGHAEVIISSCSSGSCGIQQLWRWVSDVYDFLTDWYKTQQEEEMKKQEEMCEQREKDKKEFEKVCEKYHYYMRKAREYKVKIEEVRRKLREFLRIKEREENKTVKNLDKYNYAKKQMKEEDMHEFLDDQYRYFESREMFHKNLEEKIESDAPSCFSDITSLKLDFMC